MTKLDASSYIIVGAGVFGASTAYHLIQKYPSANVLLIDRTQFPCENGASWDLNKAIRADYGNILYMEKALEALESWRSDPLFMPFYHETGLVWVDKGDSPRRIMENYQHLKAEEKFELRRPEELNTLFGGLHRDADYTDIKEVFINYSSGWADAEKALTHVIEEAIDLGVQYQVATIEAVVFDKAGKCTGVRTSSGETLTATHTILATGAATPKILADSAPEREEMQVGDRIIAAAICECSVQLGSEDAERFRGAPVFVHEAAPTQGGVIPLNTENKLKYWRDVSFKNTVQHPSGRQMSMPPSDPDYAQWKLSPGMKAEMDVVNKGILGQVGADFTMQDYRICWDAITPNQDFVICAHPHSQGLYIATGGSFHGWKFLPILGKYVVQMIEGTLAPALESIWAWDRSDKGAAHGGLLPHREMKDV